MPATYYTEQMGWGRGLNDYPAQMLEEWEVQQIPLNRIEWLKNDTHCKFLFRLFFTPFLFNYSISLQLNN